MVTVVDKVVNIDKVFEVLGSIYTINSGGCGIAAYTIYLFLKKHNLLPNDFAIVYLHDDFWSEDSFHVNNSFLTGETKQATACTHAVVFMNGDYYDSHGIYEGDLYDNQLFITTEVIDKFMKASLNGGNWNSQFNRDGYLPVIEKELGIEFNLD